MVQHQEINALPITVVTTEPSTLTCPQQALYYRLPSCGKYFNQGNQTRQARRQILHGGAKQYRLIILTKMQLHVGLYTIRCIGHRLSSAHLNRRENLTTVHVLSNTQNNTNTTNIVQESF